MQGGILPPGQGRAAGVDVVGFMPAGSDGGRDFDGHVRVVHRLRGVAATLSRGFLLAIVALPLVVFCSVKGALITILFVSAAWLSTRLLGAAITLALGLIGLIESLAEIIASRLLSGFAAAGVATVVVRVRKPEVQLPGPLDAAGVEITRRA